MTLRIALATDFGAGSPYLGQLRLRLAQLAPGVPVFDLVSDLVPFRPDLARVLLARLAESLPRQTVVLAVVDPGVGGARQALAVEADGVWFVGPDNGILFPTLKNARDVRAYRVDWRPDQLSASFHARDLFAPIAAQLCQGSLPAGVSLPLASLAGYDAPDDLSAVVYVDSYGNLMTGLRGSQIADGAKIRAGRRHLAMARTFCEVPVGTAFWYRNSIGLVELAVNQGRADQTLSLRPGDPIEVS